MKEILFRVWNGYKMEDSIVAGKYGAFFVNPEAKEDGLDPNDTASLTPANTRYHDNILVMQFTGFLDGNGTKIFEDDIFHYTKHDGYLLESFDAIVVYDEKYAAFGYQKISENGTYKEQPIHYFTEHDEIQIDILPYLGVIGHIYNKK